jgi:hypothetical protein
VFCTLKVPAGLYVLSLYNFNKDGHARSNRFRDYRLSVRLHPSDRSLGDITAFDKQPELARARMRDFWNGAYKRFLVRGPTEITFQVSRNHSLNTILAGVLLDLVDEYPLPYYHTLDEWKALCAKREKDRQTMAAAWQDSAQRSKRFAPAVTAADAAVRLFDEVERMRLANAPWWARESRTRYAACLRWNVEALRIAPSGQNKDRKYARATTCCYQLGLFARWEAGQVILGKVHARQIDKALKWDGVSDFEGKGYETITAYLACKQATVSGHESTKVPGKQQ